jgi:hypothetical protein
LTRKIKKELAMKKMLTIIASVLLVLGFSYGASAWIFVPDQGDTGFVVSNVIDNSAYSELLLDNLSQRGAGNPGFETMNLSGYDLLGTSFATVSESATSISGNTYDPTQGDFLAVIQGIYNGINTSQFSNGTDQKGTVGSILETGITLAPGEQFSFDWAFLGNDLTPWNDFALFYLKDPISGDIAFSEGLAQIGSIPVPSTLLLLGSGLLGLLGLIRKSRSQD